MLKYGDHAGRGQPAASRDGLFLLHAIQAVLANSVRTPSAMLIATTCDELRPLALRAAAVSGVASMELRSDRRSSSLVCAATFSTFDRTSGLRSFMLTTCMLRMIVDLSDGACSDGACACALGR